MGIPHFFKKYESYFGKELFGVYWDPNEQDKTIKPFVAICSTPIHGCTGLVQCIREIVTWNPEQIATKVFFVLNRRGPLQ